MAKYKVKERLNLQYTNWDQILATADVLLGEKIKCYDYHKMVDFIELCEIAAELRYRRELRDKVIEEYLCEVAKEGFPCKRKEDIGKKIGKLD